MMKQLRSSVRALFAFIVLVLALSVMPPALAAPVASPDAPLATTLVAGDIAIIGINTDDADQFSFVLLTNITASTQINFTDNGWLSSGAFRTGEGTMTWTASSDLCAGTVVNPAVSGMAFSASGDQILAYQGAAASPTFVYALNDEGAGVWQATAADSNTSALPTGLTNGTTAVALTEIDNAIYTGTTSGTRAALLAAISNNANWAGSDGTRQTMPTGPFTVTDAPACGGETAPAVSSTSPAPGATGVAANAMVSVTFNESVAFAGTVDIVCTGATQTVTPTDGPTTWNLPHADFTAGDSCSIIIPAGQITDTDTDDPPDTMAADYTWSFTVAGGITKIHAIQGSGSTSTTGTFTVEAIVVGDFQGVTGVDDYKLDGFFIQEEDADIDANAATSEGIFVYCATCPTNVAVGDKVQVTGTSSEYFNMSQLNATTAGAVVVIGSGNPLPTPAALTLPVPGVTAPDLAGATTQINAYYEPFEGMLVRIAEQLSVTEYFELSRYGQLVLAQGGRFRQFTDLAAPSTTGYNAHQIDLAKRTVILDDDSNQQNHAISENPDIAVFHPVPGFSIANYVRGGDTITNLTGALHWSFAGLTGTDAWRIRPVTGAFSYAFTSGNARSAAPALSGNVKVASFNVLNYFTTLNSRGANSTAELDRQAAKIVAALMGLDADVIGVMEIENNGTAIADLVSRLNAAAGAGAYAYVNTGVVGSDEITVGILYKPAKVTPVGTVKTLTLAAFTDPNGTGTQRNRPAVAQTFQDATWGEKFTVVVNHLKSKGSCPSSGPDTDQGDGQGCWNDTRQKAAAYLVSTWLPSDPTGSGDTDFVIIGDLNSYRLEDPITNITGAGYVDLIDRDMGAAGYGYVFDGQLGYLDHALASPSLAAQAIGATEWHINADEVNLLDYNDTIQDTGEATFDVKPNTTPLYEPNAYRSSDHDPVLISLGLCPAATTPAGLGITRNQPISGVDVRWTAAPVNASYEIWRQTAPYFTPDPLTQTPHGTVVASPFPDPDSVGDPDTNYYYAVTGVSACGGRSPMTGLSYVGEFDFALVKGQ